MKLAVRSVIGERAITLDDGQNVYSRIIPELKAGHSVELDFEGVNVFASPFFNAAIGQLLKDMSSEDLNRLLKIGNLAPTFHDVLKRVIDNAKSYYSSPDVRDAQNKFLRKISEENDAR